METRSLRASPSLLVGLIAVAVFINYVDRGNLATAAPLLKDELHLTNTQFGLLVSAFFWTYIPAQLVIGWLTTRVSAYRLMAWGVALWSLATLLSGVFSGLTTLIGLRLLLGLGESVSFPCSSKLLADNLPAAKLGHANGLVTVGQALGPAIGTFGGGLLMAQFGWRAVFVMFGVISLLWLLPWMTVQRPASSQAGAAPVEAPTFLAIGRQRALWGACIGHFSGNFALYFIFAWLPLYLVKTRGFSVVEMAQFAGLLYLGYALAAWVSGWLTDRRIAAGASLNTVRKTTIAAGHIGVALCLLLCAVGSPLVSLAALFASGLMFGIITPALYAIGQTLAGPVAAGKWAGLQNCVANTAGIIGPIITGMIIDATGQFTWAFVAVGVITLVGAAGWALIIPRVAPVDWK